MKQFLMNLFIMSIVAIPLRAEPEAKVDLKKQIREFSGEATFLQMTSKMRLEAAKKDKNEASAACFEFGVFSSTFTTADELLKADGKSLDKILRPELRRSLGIKSDASVIAWSEAQLQIACDKVSKGENPDEVFTSVTNLGDIVFPTLIQAYGGQK